MIQINSELETSDLPLDCSLAVGTLGRKVWAAVDLRQGLKCGGVSRETRQELLHGPGEDGR